MTRIRQIAAFFLALAALLAAPSAQAGGRLEVIELFTSQGCSSCPPADRLLETLARREGVLALSMPVDIWDWLGWKDTLASPVHTRRQRAYAYARGDRHSVFTPQAIVNGIESVIGSDASAVAGAVARTGRSLAMHPVALTVAAEGDGLVIEAGEGDGRGTLWLVLYEPEHAVAIARGENRGRTVTYVNVVRHIAPVGRWAGRAQRISVSGSDLPDRTGKRCAVLLQDGTAEKPGAIRAAALLDPEG